MSFVKLYLSHIKKIEDLVKNIFLTVFKILQRAKISPKRQPSFAQHNSFYFMTN
jgi:hypothetical protein